MKMLLQGGESCERYELLLGLCSIKSEQVKKATRAYLVNGWSEETIELTYDVSTSNLNRALKTLNRVAADVERLFELRNNSKSVE